MPLPLDRVDNHLKAEVLIGHLNPAQHAINIAEHIVVENKPFERNPEQCSGHAGAFVDHIGTR